MYSLRRMIHCTQSVKVSGVTAAAYSGVKTVAAVTTTSVANDTFTVTGVGADPGASTLTNARVSPSSPKPANLLRAHKKLDHSQHHAADTQDSQHEQPAIMIAASGVVTRVTDTICR